MKNKCELEMGKDETEKKSYLSIYSALDDVLFSSVQYFFLLLLFLTLDTIAKMFTIKFINE